MTLSSYYLPPVSWFARLVQSDEPVLVEQWANYRKQTFHNRCYIDSPNGKLALTIPVDRSTFAGGKCLMKDVQVSDHTDWQRQHWYALESSYYNSPFFEYLQDDFRPVYLKRWKWLMDMNETLVQKCLELTGIGNRELQRTESFVRPLAEPLAQEPLSFPPYYQVFREKHGFLPDLSIIDLIFNLGPESIIYLHTLARK